MISQTGLPIAAVLLLTAGTALVPQQDSPATKPVRPVQPSITPGVETTPRDWSEPAGDMQNWLRKFEGTWRVQVRDFADPKSDTSKPKTGTATGQGAGTGAGAAGTGKTISGGPDSPPPRDGGGAAGDTGTTPPTDDAKKDDAAGVEHTSECMARTVILHGQHAHTTVRGTHQGRTFEGTRVLGYNNGAKRFESFWMDNRHSGMIMTTGQIDSDQKILTLRGEMPDEKTGKMMQLREVLRWASDDQFTSEILIAGAAGQEERRAMMYTFNRVRAGDADAPAGTTPGRGAGETTPGTGSPR